VKHKAVDTDLFVPCHAHALYELLLVADGRERGHEPAVAVVALPNVIGGRAFDEELRFLENILY
jgi:hypothetical protein